MIEIYAKELQDVKTAEKYIHMMKDMTNKVVAYLTCGKLKAAYLSAVRIRNRTMVEIVRDEAKRTESKMVYDLCQKYLDQGTDM